MNKIEQVLVCLDRTQYDEQVLEFASKIVSGFGSKKVYFLHAAQENLDNTIKKELRQKVKDHFDARTETEVQVFQGSDAADLLKWKEIKDVDLLVLGMKPKSISSGMSATKLLNGAPCSVFLVPFRSKIEFNKALVPIDFSKSSYVALERAVEIQDRLGIDLLLQHVYFVPSGYHTSGKSYGEFAAIMQKNAQRDFHKFMKEHKLDSEQFEITYTLDDDNKPADRIYDIAKENEAGMIVLGSKGRTKAASVISSSTAANIVKYDQDIPYLVVKSRKSNLGLLGAILKI